MGLLNEVLKPKPIAESVNGIKLYRLKETLKPGTRVEVNGKIGTIKKQLSTFSEDTLYMVVHKNDDVTVATEDEITLKEAVEPIDADLDLEQQLFELTKRMDAARRGLGIANKMGPRSKAIHRSRVMGNLNQIRGALSRVIKQLEEFDSASSDYEVGRGYSD